MRPSLFAIPLGLLMTATGIFFFMKAQPSMPALPTTEVRHPVTKDMEVLAASWSKQVSPLNMAPTVEGSFFDLKGALGRGPVFVYFIKDGCPCSVDAQPLFNRIAQKWGEKASFVGIIDKSPLGAKAWMNKNKPQGQVIPDEEKWIIRSFRASNSAFSAIVNKDGKIEKMWPGYSKEYLVDINKTMAKLLSEPEGTLDTAYAPLTRTAGCSFSSLSDPAEPKSKS